MKKILVTGGAGYIGSHICRFLKLAGFEPIVFDDLSTGNEKAVLWGPFVKGSLLDEAALDTVFQTYSIDTVIHLGGKALVAESMQAPASYVEHNTLGTMRLLEAMERAAVRRILFSSTCAVYGIPEQERLDENHPIQPTSPYGLSKWMAEEAIRYCSEKWGFSYIIFRYFNAAGASSCGQIGEQHDPETHLIPLAIGAALGTHPPLKIFGTALDTPDGTCIRDYIHVDDIAKAHLLALDTTANLTLNLGSGSGFSVRDIITALQGYGSVPYTEEAPRLGDPPKLVADITKAQKELGFSPTDSNLHHILKTAYTWAKGQGAKYEELNQ